MCWLTKTCRPRGERDRVLQVTADGEDGRRVLTQRQRQRRIAARAPQHHLAPEHDAHDRVVDVADDRPVVDEEQVGDPAEASQRVALRRCRSARPTGCRSSRRPARPTSRSSSRCSGVYGQQHAEVGIARRDRAAQSRPPPGRGAASSTIGDSGEASRRCFVRPIRRSRSAIRSSDGYITANGFSSRCLRARSRLTASSSAAHRPSGEIRPGP